MTIGRGKILWGAVLVLALISVLLFAAACGGGTSGTSSTAAGGSSTTAAGATTTASGASTTAAGAGDASAGKTIYVKGTDASGKAITRTTDMGVLGQDGCVSCHGDDAKGKTGVKTDVGTADAPDIRWSTISQPGQGENGETEPAYDATSFAKAVRDGLDPSGGQLEPEMPKWQVTDPEILDLIAYLKTL